MREKEKKHDAIFRGNWSNVFEIIEKFEIISGILV